MQALFKSIVAGLFLSAWIVSFAHAEAYFGVGATFPNQAYQAWAKNYVGQSNTRIIYTPVGSGKGIAEIIAKRTDFGATDKPLPKEEQDKYQLVQFPMLLGGIVPVVNLKNIVSGQLQLDGMVLANIYMGRITRWNDDAIVALNPGVKLPNEPINVIVREDKSGATFNLTNYLSKVSPEWKTTIGEGMTVPWKVGEIANGNEEQFRKFTGTPNSIACLDFSDVQKNHLNPVRMKNKEGVFVAPEVNAFRAAAVSTKWHQSNGFAEVLTDQPGIESWPITTATYLLLNRTGFDPLRTQGMVAFFDWAYLNGDETAKDLSYAPLPEDLKKLVRAEWSSQLK